MTESISYEVSHRRDTSSCHVCTAPSIICKGYRLNWSIYNGVQGPCLKGQKSARADPIPIKMYTMPKNEYHVCVIVSRLCDSITQTWVDPNWPSSAQFSCFAQVSTSLFHAFYHIHGTKPYHLFCFHKILIGKVLIIFWKVI